MRFPKQICTSAVAVLIFATAMAAHAGTPPKFDAIYVFGDSYNDVGNLFLASGETYPPSPYYQGRFSNGRLWVEHVAGSYGLPMTPSITGGTDFAFGGAEVLQAVPLGKGEIPSVPDQIEDYLSLHGGKADPHALYIVEGGGNDILDATGGSPTALGDSIAHALLTSIHLLEQAGARNLFVPRLFDVGLLPEAKEEGIAAFATTATAALNQGLDDGLQPEHFLKETHIYRIDTYTLLNAVFTDGSHYGFHWLSTPCLDTSVSPATVCGDPERHYFWDSVHPTTFGHAFFAVLAEQELNH
jgi:phospholipase/lecithinase/hemolysin